MELLKTGLVAKSGIKKIAVLSKAVTLAEKKLAKDKSNATLKKSLKEAQKPITAIEQELSKCVDLLVAKLKEMTAAHAEMAKLNPMPPIIATKLQRIRKIVASGRAPELKDLMKDQKRDTVHSNPSKLERLFGDLNSDVADTNALQDDVDSETDKFFATQIAQLKSTIENGLPSGITGHHIGLDSDIKELAKAGKASRWGKFDRQKAALIASVKKSVAGAVWESQIRALQSHSDYLLLNRRKKNKIFDLARGKSLPTIQVKAALDQAMTKQLSPSKSQWVQHLGMTGYTVSGISGRYDGAAIHITFDQNSWSQDTDGGISVAANNAKAILGKLLGISDWRYQLHATLEVDDGTGKHPHVYFGGHDNHWEDAARHNGKTLPDWKNKGVEELKAVIVKLKKQMIVKIQDAIDKKGDI